METPYEFREKGSITLVLIMIELLKGRRKLREIASDLKITPQGASVYIKNLQKMNYVGKDMSPTRDGVAFLQKMLADMSIFVEQAYREAGIISSCEALAGDEIEKGDEVSLQMKNGILYAFKNDRFGSRGTAVFGVTRGEPLEVSNIRGLINYKPGNFFIIRVDFQSYREVKFKKLSEFCKNNGVEFIGAFGVLAYRFCHRSSLNAAMFAPVEGCIEASVKGLNSLLVFSPEMSRFLFRKISENIDKYKINPKFVEI
ncbi:MAG: hypothetical protein QW100_02600 [Thermoplasmatales archaeon]